MVAKEHRLAHFSASNSPSFGKALSPKSTETIKSIWTNITPVFYRLNKQHLLLFFNSDYKIAKISFIFYINNVS